MSIEECTKGEKREHKIGETSKSHSKMIDLTAMN